MQFLYIDLPFPYFVSLISLAYNVFFNFCAFHNGIYPENEYCDKDAGMQVKAHRN